MDHPNKLLLVEDNPGDARLFREMLREGEGASFEVEWVPRISEALARLAQNQVDLILLDLHLPDGSGMELIQRLRLRYQGVPIVVLTGAFDEATGIEAMKHGAQDYLLKDSVDRRILLRTIRYAIERHHLQQLKDEFLKMVSHELKTPLSITREGLNQLLEEVRGAVNEEQKKILLLGVKSIDRVTRLIHDLLDLSQIEAGRMGLKKERLNLVQLAQEVASSLQPRAQANGLSLEVRTPPEGLEAAADRDKVTQILTNLVGNAIKFTKAGTVEIGLSDAGDSIVSSVVDTGPGIAPEDLPKVFGKFQQLGHTPVTGEKGTGLGLAITKALVELHGGTIRVESTVGRGTAFTFILPKGSPTS